MGMKSNYWMIGDWTYYTELHYQEKIIALDSLNHLVGFRKSHLSIDWCDMDECSPIPLTADIMEANGFDYKERSTSNALMVKHGDGYVIEVFMFKNGWVFDIERNYFLNEEYAMDRVHKCGIYVHEFQHALRLCGLNEMAENIKV